MRVGMFSRGHRVSARQVGNASYSISLKPPLEERELVKPPRVRLSVSGKWRILAKPIWLATMAAMLAENIPLPARAETPPGAESVDRNINKGGDTNSRPEADGGTEMAGARVAKTPKPPEEDLKIGLISLKAFVEYQIPEGARGRKELLEKLEKIDAQNPDKKQVAEAVADAARILYATGEKWQAIKTQLANATGLTQTVETTVNETERQAIREEARQQEQQQRTQYAEQLAEKLEQAKPKIATERRPELDALAREIKRKKPGELDDAYLTNATRQTARFMLGTGEMNLEQVNTALRPLLGPLLLESIIDNALAPLATIPRGAAPARAEAGAEMGAPPIAELAEAPPAPAPPMTAGAETEQQRMERHDKGIMREGFEYISRNFSNPSDRQVLLESEFISEPSKEMLRVFEYDSNILTHGKDYLKGLDEEGMGKLNEARTSLSTDAQRVLTEFEREKSEAARGVAIGPKQVEELNAQIASVRRVITAVQQSADEEKARGNLNQEEYGKISGKLREYAGELDGYQSSPQVALMRFGELKTTPAERFEVISNEAAAMHEAISRGVKYTPTEEGRTRAEALDPLLSALMTPDEKEAFKQGSLGIIASNFDYTTTVELTRMMATMGYMFTNRSDRIAFYKNSELAKKLVGLQARQALEVTWELMKAYAPIEWEMSGVVSPTFTYKGFVPYSAENAQTITDPLFLSRMRALKNGAYEQDAADPASPGSDVLRHVVSTHGELAFLARTAPAIIMGGNAQYVRELLHGRETSPGTFDPAGVLALDDRIRAGFGNQAAMAVQKFYSEVVPAYAERFPLTGYAESNRNILILYLSVKRDEFQDSKKVDFSDFKDYLSHPMLIAYGKRDVRYDAEGFKYLDLREALRPPLDEAQVRLYERQPMTFDQLMPGIPIGTPRETFADLSRFKWDTAGATETFANVVNFPVTGYVMPEGRYTQVGLGEHVTPIEEIVNILYDVKRDPRMVRDLQTIIAPNMALQQKIDDVIWTLAQATPAARENAMKKVDALIIELEGGAKVEDEVKAILKMPERTTAEAAKKEAAKKAFIEKYSPATKSTDLFERIFNPPNEEIRQGAIDELYRSLEERKSQYRNLKAGRVLAEKIAEINRLEKTARKAGSEGESAKKEVTERADVLIRELNSGTYSTFDDFIYGMTEKYGFKRGDVVAALRKAKDGNFEGLKKIEAKSWFLSGSGFQAESHGEYTMDTSISAAAKPAVETGKTQIETGATAVTARGEGQLQRPDEFARVLGPTGVAEYRPVIGATTPVARLNLDVTGTWGPNLTTTTEYGKEQHPPEAPGVTDRAEYARTDSTDLFGSTGAAGYNAQHVYGARLHTLRLDWQATDAATRSAQRGGLLPTEREGVPITPVPVIETTTETGTGRLLGQTSFETERGRLFTAYGLTESQDAWTTTSAGETSMSLRDLQNFLKQSQANPDRLGEVASIRIFLPFELAQTELEINGRLREIGAEPTREGKLEKVQALLDYLDERAGELGPRFDQRTTRLNVNNEFLLDALQKVLDGTDAMTLNELTPYDTRYAARLDEIKAETNAGRKKEKIKQLVDDMKKEQERFAREGTGQGVLQGYRYDHKTARMFFNPDVRDVQLRPALGPVRAAGVGGETFASQYVDRGYGRFYLDLGEDANLKLPGWVRNWWLSGGMTEYGPGVGAYPGQSTYERRQYADMDKVLGNYVYTASYEKRQTWQLEENGLRVGVGTAAGAAENRLIPGEIRFDLRLFNYTIPKAGQRYTVSPRGEWRLESGGEVQTTTAHAIGTTGEWRLPVPQLRITEVGYYSPTFEEWIAGVGLEQGLNVRMNVAAGRENELLTQQSASLDQQEFLDMNRYFGVARLGLPRLGLDMSYFVRKPETQRVIKMTTPGMEAPLTEEEQRAAAEAAAKATGGQATQAPPGSGLQMPPSLRVPSVGTVEPAEEGDVHRFKLSFSDRFGRGGGLGYEFMEATPLLDPLGNTIVDDQGKTQYVERQAGVVTLLGPWELAWPRTLTPNEKIGFMTEELNSLSGEVDKQEEGKKIDAATANAYRQEITRYRTELSGIPEAMGDRVEFMRDKVLRLKSRVEGKPLDYYLEGLGVGGVRWANWDKFQLQAGVVGNERFRTYARLEVGKEGRVAGGAEAVVDLTRGVSQLKFKGFSVLEDPTRRRNEFGVSYLNDNVLSVPSMGLFYTFDQGLLNDMNEGTARVTERIANGGWAYLELRYGAMNTYRTTDASGKPLMLYFTPESLTSEGMVHAIDLARENRVLNYRDEWWRGRTGVYWLLNPTSYFNNMTLNLEGEVGKIYRTYHVSDFDRAGQAFPVTSHDQSKLDYRVMLKFTIVGLVPL